MTGASGHQDGVRLSGGFDLGEPLPDGVTVLEASAGTGKTYTIAALASRLVAEGTPLERLLLVTFTRAATGELRERVRERLLSSERALADVLAGRQAQTGDDADPVVSLLAAGSAQEVEQRRQRLADALANFDAATIETTHGFCQRVLDELGTLADLEPDVRFVEDIGDLLEEIVDDLYVRRFHRHRESLTLTREEAGRIARLAAANPTAPIHPRSAPQDSAPAMRARLALAARVELERRKRAQALMTHDDQLTRLLGTLQGPGGTAAATMLRERYRVVLIDEFQDTDPIQWEIVRLAFDGGGVKLVLIGDPKQAIYAFRGADVYAYLQAARSASRRATLDVNHRSDQGLLDALDALFGNVRLGHPEIVYRRVRAAREGGAPRLVGAPHATPLRLRLVDSKRPEIRRTGGGWPSAPSVRDYIAGDLAEEVVSLLSSQATVARRDRPDSAVAPGDLAVLVYSHRQAGLIQATLHAAGVPAVINGSGSVFATPAANDWRTVLEALERPTSPARARSAALTPLIGWSAAKVAEADERLLEELHQRLYGWARVLRERGVAAMTQSILAGQAVPARLLSRPDGERYLTDLEHVSQLLHAAAGAEHLGIAALTGWLRQRIAAARREGSNEELTRRLDTDADAVQVLTFHRSKGLEFPIVYCPFLWEPEPLSDSGEPIYFHDAAEGDLRAIDVGLEGAEYREHHRQHCAEERGEELRHMYVALTRAKHQAVVWWASSWNAKDSALGRLLLARDVDGNVDWTGGSRPSDASVRERLAEVVAAAPHAVAVEAAEPSGLPTSWSGRAPSGATLSVARIDRRLDTRWRRTSYSAITAAAHETLVGSEPEEAGVTDEPSTTGPAGGVPGVDAAGVPGVDAAGTATGARAVALAQVEPALAAMAAGPRLGTVIHRVLELVEFDSPDLVAALESTLSSVTARSPGVLGAPASAVATGLAAALETPLGGSLGELSLSQVSRADRLDELEFELPLAGGETPSGDVALADVAAVLQRHLPDDDPMAGYPQRLLDPTLAGGLRGYLTGTIDLVLRSGSVPGAGRPGFHVVDYKTNWLGQAERPLTAWDYRPSALAAEMQRSHYTLQALLYMVALHRFLRWRLPDYRPDTDLGGVRYLFLRGMLGGERAGALPDGRAGVFAWQPPSSLIVELSEVLDGA